MTASLCSYKNYAIHSSYDQQRIANCSSILQNASFHFSPIAIQPYAICKIVSQRNYHSSNTVCSNSSFPASFFNSINSLKSCILINSEFNFTSFGFKSSKLNSQFRSNIRASSEAAWNFRRVNQSPIGNEIKEGQEVSIKEKSASSWEKLKKRAIFGILIATGAIFGIVAGGWIFTAFISLSVLLGTREFFDLVAASLAVRNERPPHRLSVTACCLASTAMPLITMYNGGEVLSSLMIAFSIVLTSLLLQSRRPRLIELKSLLLSLFYTGYLPSFWVKIRCGLVLPVAEPQVLVKTGLVQVWPNLLGGPLQCTLGMVLTFLCFSTIIAADTGAYLGGKTFGKTKLIDISPKKTLEGAFFGLMASLLTTVTLSKLFRWPTSIISSCALSFVIFSASLFGDLLESYLKRDAGVKDSGNLIPGHGGVLDRADSYIITGAVVFGFLKYVFPYLP